MQLPKKLDSVKMKSVLLTSLLVAMALLGPTVAYAGVSVVWPESDVGAGVDTTPPLTFSAGTDHADANTLGFIDPAFSATNNGASFTLTLNGLSGGTVTIDDVVNLSVGSGVASHKVEVSTAAADATQFTVLKLRLWTGSTAPTADGDAQVCAVLDLTSTADTESANACTKSTKMQLIIELPDGSSASDTVSIRPSSIVFS